MSRTAPNSTTGSILVSRRPVTGGGIGRSGAAEALDDSPPSPPEGIHLLAGQHHSRLARAASENKVQLLPLHIQSARLVPFGGQDERRRRTASSFSTATAKATSTKATPLVWALRLRPFRQTQPPTPTTPQTPTVCLQHLLSRLPPLRRLFLQTPPSPLDDIS